MVSYASCVDCTPDLSSLIAAFRDMIWHNTSIVLVLLRALLNFDMEQKPQMQVNEAERQQFQPLKHREITWKTLLWVYFMFPAKGLFWWEIALQGFKYLWCSCTRCGLFSHLPAASVYFGGTLLTLKDFLFKHVRSSMKAISLSKATSSIIVIFLKAV